MIWHPLSGEVWANTPDSVKASRARRWRVIVTHLQADHYARYHAPQEARIAEWAQTRGVA